MITKTLRLIISGSVQGIGYRKWIKRHARRAGVVGWVTNREDGAVEAVLQGDMDAVDVLVREARTGPILANVTAVAIEEMSHDVNMIDFIVVQ